MKNAKEMVWKDKDLEARYRRNLEAMEERHRRHPKLASPWALPYKVFTENSMHGIQNMRIRWLIANRPQEYREMMMANVLEQHLWERNDAHATSTAGTWTCSWSRGTSNAART